MDVFKLETTAINSSLVNVNTTSCDIPEVSFDAGSEFNLNFFDTPEDSNTQGCFSDSGSVESLSISSPPPTPVTPVTPTIKSLTSTQTSIATNYSSIDTFSSASSLIISTNTTNNNNNNNNNSNSTTRSNQFLQSPVLGNIKTGKLT